MRTAMVILLLGLSLLLAAPARAQDDVTGAMLARLNAARGEAGLPPLALNAPLNAAAQRHSDDMAAHDFLAHDGSDGSSTADRVEAAGYRWVALGENVAQTWAVEANEVFDIWMTSGGHRDNILSPLYSEVGFAHASAADGRVFYTLTFGAPPGGSAAPPPVEVETTPAPLTASPPAPEASAAAAQAGAGSSSLPAAPTANEHAVIYNAQGIALIPEAGIPPELWFQATPEGYDPTAEASATPSIDGGLLLFALLLGGTFLAGLLAAALWVVLRRL